MCFSSLETLGWWLKCVDDFPLTLFRMVDQWCNEREFLLLYEPIVLELF